MLRGLVLLLLLANVGVWAWTHGWLPAGWLAPPDGLHQREPGRLAAQVRPEVIELLTPAEGRQLAAALCLQAGPFDGTQWAAAEAAAQRAGLAVGTWQRVPVPEPGAGAWLRVPEADAAQQALLQSAQDADLGLGFRPCP